MLRMGPRCRPRCPRCKCMCCSRRPPGEAHRSDMRACPSKHWPGMDGSTRLACSAVAFSESARRAPTLPESAERCRDDSSPRAYSDRGGAVSLASSRPPARRSVEACLWGRLEPVLPRPVPYGPPDTAVVNDGAGVRRREPGYRASPRSPHGFRMPAAVGTARGTCWPGRGRTP